MSILHYCSKSIIKIVDAILDIIRHDLYEMNSKYLFALKIVRFWNICSLKEVILLYRVCAVYLENLCQANSGNRLAIHLIYINLYSSTLNLFSSTWLDIWSILEFLIRLSSIHIYSRASYWIAEHNYII